MYPHCLELKTSADKITIELSEGSVKVPTRIDESLKGPRIHIPVMLEKGTFDALCDFK